VTTPFDLARMRDPDRALAAAFAVPALREALAVLICLDHELARARAVVREPMAALIRLQWWRDAIAEAAAGAAPRRHEVAEPLAGLIAGRVVEPGPLLALVDARESEAEPGPPEPAAFQAWARGTGGGFAVLAARLLGCPPALLPTVEQAGAVFAIARAIRSRAEQARQGRQLLPDGPPDVLAAETLAVAEALRPALRRLPRAALPAVLTLPLARADLRRAARAAPLPEGRLFGERAAVVLAGLLGRP
jgi:phytoene synthase